MVPFASDVREGASGVDQEGSVAKEDRGFASMDRAKQREIASKGGKAAHQKGTAHEWTSEEAREAGRKGGMASHRRRKEMMDQGGPETPSQDTPQATERAGGDDQNELIR
jgi:general stress protein YciG